MSALLLSLLLAGPIPNSFAAPFAGNVNGNVLSNYTIAHRSVASSPTSLATTECGESIDDIGSSGLQTVNLPASPTAGCFFAVRVTTANGIKLVANTGQTTRLGALVSASAGYVQSLNVGTVLYVEATSSTTWIGAIKADGWWSIDGGYSANAGGRYKNTTALTEAILVGSSAGQFGHADGVTVAAAVTGRRMVFDSALIVYTWAAATYATCSGGVVKYYNGSTGNALTASETASSVFTATESTNWLGTHNDTSVSTGSTNLSDFATGNSLIFNGTACTNGGSADGTATITVFFHFDE